MASIDLHPRAEVLAPAPPLARLSAACRSIPVALGAIVALSALLRMAVAAGTPAPWILPDELIYSELARSFGETAHFAVRDAPWSAWSFGPLYPVLIAPVFAAIGPAHAYLVAKLVNCLLFSLAALPAYAIGRRALSRRWSLVFAVATVFVPSVVYTSKLMTESLAYPLFLVAVLAIVRAIERPTWQRELQVLMAIAAATLARGQLVVLFPSFVATVLAIAVLEERDAGRLRLRSLRRRVAAHRTTWVAALAAVAAVAAASASGLSNELAGGHGEAFASVSFSALATSFLYHVAELDLYLGMLPFAAAAALCVVVFRKGANERFLRLLCVLTLSVTVLLAAAAARYLVAVYKNVPDAYPVVFDRYTFYAAPLFFLAFLVWISRGVRRPRARTTVAIAGLAAALPLVLPYGELLTGRTWGANSSSVALVPWGILRSATGTLSAVYAVLGVGGLCLAYLFVRSNSGRRLVFFAAANVAIVTLLAQAGNSSVSQRALRLGAGSAPDREWVDRAVGPKAHVTALWSGLRTRGPRGWHPIWQAEFFNASVGPVYNLREPMLYALPSTKAETHGRALFADGRRLVAEYVLTDRQTPVAGKLVAANAKVGMAVYRVDGPVSLR